jgi:thiazole/oxazole-forming peptide maturase SagD family component
MNSCTGGTVLIPAGVVDMTFQPVEPEPAVMTSNSTGMAFHTELHRALWAALCEVAERDALMIAWLTRRHARAIDFGRKPPSPIADRVRKLDKVGLSAHLVDLTWDFPVPTVLCLLMSPTGPSVTAGCCCNSDAVAACTRAIDEAVVVRHGMTGRRFDAPNIDRFDWVGSLEEHALLFADRRMVHHLDFLLGPGVERISIEEFTTQGFWKVPADFEAFRSAAALLEQRGLTVLWTELTAPEAISFGFVVKVVVPQMVPLSTHYDVRWLGAARLHRALGIRNPAVADFNPIPHPFA